MKKYQMYEQRYVAFQNKRTKALITGTNFNSKDKHQILFSGFPPLLIEWQKADLIKAEMQRRHISTKTYEPVLVTVLCEPYEDWEEALNKAVAEGVLKNADRGEDLFEEDGNG